MCILTIALTHMNLICTILVQLYWWARSAVICRFASPIFDATFFYKGSQRRSNHVSILFTSDAKLLIEKELICFVFV